ncbi:hypothetical protein MPL3356_160064 [Mesorhizobium plurifarium]|uniref:Uncharacterized protein n=1 Tax=Mesorhizobium plurifarium TaxID=69974 RepID=A0A090DKW3_MESPL|nr:hypothetical protein MPL3356_160064 [Mesorhizobium plurifarium]
MLGIGKSRFVGLAFQVCPGTYARRGSISVWSLKGLSGGVMLRSWVRCDNVVRSANRYRLRRLAGRLLGGEAIERRPASLTVLRLLPWVRDVNRR